MALTALLVALGWTLIHSLWQGSLIYLVGKLLTAQNLPSRSKHASLLILAMSQLIWSVYTFLQHFSFQETEQALPLSQGVVDALLSHSALPTQSVASWNGFALVAIFWVSGLIYFLLRQLLGLYTFRTSTFQSAPTHWQSSLDRITQQWSANLKVFLHPTISTPCLYGVIKPVILFPTALATRLTPQEVEYILAHEVAHFLHRDYLSNLAVQFIAGIYYYHPLLQRHIRQLHLQRELACDAWVVCSQQVVPLDYAKTLVRLSELKINPGMSLTFAGEPAQLTQRIKHLLNLKNTFDMKSHLWPALLALSFVLTSLLLVNYQWQTKPQSPDQEIPSNAAAPAAALDQSYLSTDSLPKSYKNYSVTMDNGKVTKLIVDGKRIKPEDYHHYAELIAPPPPPAAPAPPAAPSHISPPSPAPAPAPPAATYHIAPPPPPAAPRAPSSKFSPPPPPSPAWPRTIAPPPPPRDSSFNWNWQHDYNFEFPMPEINLELAEHEKNLRQHKHALEQEYQAMQLQLEHELKMSNQWQEQQLLEQRERLRQQELEMKAFADAMAAEEKLFQEQHRQMEKFFEELKTELNKDGLWKKGDQLNINTQDDGTIKINGKPIPEKYQNKYHQWLDKQPPIGVHPPSLKKQ